MGGKAIDGAETVSSLLGNLPNAPKVLPDIPIKADELVRTAPFVIWAQTYSKLIISNLPLDKDVDDIHKILSVIGPIKELS